MPNHLYIYKFAQILSLLYPDMFPSQDELFVPELCVPFPRLFT
jgi:hypothetical protein